MKKIFLYPVLLAFAIGAVASQNAEELPIPVETDNQFPPDHSEADGHTEGSGSAVLEGMVVEITTESIPIPKIENVDATPLLNEDGQEVDKNSELSGPCPKPCVCNTEGNSKDYIVDCSGYGLTEFPSIIDPRTTILKLRKNKLTEIPKSVSSLKKLRILDAYDNLIMALSDGSVSELPELVTLNLANNRLTEYPNDLKNSLSLNKLEELDLGGNTIQRIFSPEIFSTFKALRILTLPKVSPELLLDLCDSLKNTLETVCTESCKVQSFDCPDAPVSIDQGLFDATLPGMIPFHPIEENIKVSEGSDILNSSFNHETKTQNTLPDPGSPAAASNLVPEKSNVTKTDLLAYEIPLDSDTKETHDTTLVPGPSEMSSNLATNENPTTTAVSAAPKALFNIETNDATTLGPEVPETSSNTQTNYSIDIYTTSFPEEHGTPITKLSDSINVMPLSELPKITTAPELPVTVSYTEFTKVSDGNSDASVISPMAEEKGMPNTSEIPEVLLNSAIKTTSITSPAEVPEVPNASSDSKIKLAPNTAPISEGNMPLSNSGTQETDKLKFQKESEKHSTSNDGQIPVNEFSLLTAVKNAPHEKETSQNVLTETAKEAITVSPEVKVGAKTADSKAGGVDKSVIAVVVAGMVIIVAVITIKKNWNSIKKRFSSTPRPSDRTERNVNGTTPEEVPLQDKSPV